VKDDDVLEKPIYESSEGPIPKTKARTNAGRG
jgi:hypothetical protein